MRTKYITLINILELHKHWGEAAFIPNRVIRGGIEYAVVRCNKNGEVNFDTTAVYSVIELIEETNFKLIGTK